MGTRNISISEEAYERLAVLKRPGESFTEVINRLTMRGSILELAGTLTEEESKEMRRCLGEVRVVGASGGKPMDGGVAGASRIRSSLEDSFSRYERYLASIDEVRGVLAREIPDEASLSRELVELRRRETH